MKLPINDVTEKAFRVQNWEGNCNSIQCRPICKIAKIHPLECHNALINWEESWYLLHEKLWHCSCRSLRTHSRAQYVWKRMFWKSCKSLHLPPHHPKDAVMFLSFRTDRSWQTVQTPIRLLLEEQSDQGLHCLQFPLHLLDELLWGKPILFNF